MAISVKDAAAATQSVRTLTEGSDHQHTHVLEANASAQGLDTYRNAALSNTDQAVKASAGRLYGFTAYNPNDATVWLHFYNDSTTNVTTATTPYRSYPIPAIGHFDKTFVVPVNFSVAITIAASDVVADASDAPTTGLVVNVDYK